MIHEFYKNACETPSDINEHLPTLFKYASMCESITEMGVRTVVSTWAFLAAKPKKLTSIDIQYHPNIAVAMNEAKLEGLDFKFILADTTQSLIEKTDLLFIDTLHTYEQLSKELKLHSENVNKFLVFHDTTIFANVDETGYGKGLWTAISDFLEIHNEWAIEERFTNNNGLTILKRIK